MDVVTDGPELRLNYRVLGGTDFAHKLPEGNDPELFTSRTSSSAHNLSLYSAPQFERH